MKRILLLFVASLILSSCKNYKPDFCKGQWVLVNKWNLEKNERYKPSRQKIMMEFKQDGYFDYYDTTRKVGYANKYTLSGNKLKLHFVGLSNELEVNYAITQLDSNFLHIDTSPNFKNDYEATNYIFVKMNSQISGAYEGLMNE